MARIYGTVHRIDGESIYGLQTRLAQRNIDRHIASLQLQIIRDGSIKVQSSRFGGYYGGWDKYNPDIYSIYDLMPDESMDVIEIGGGWVEFK